MLPYKTEAGPRRQLKQQDKLRPPAAGWAEWVWQQLHYSRSHLIITSCVQTPLWVGGHDWREHRADNLAQIGWHDTLAKCLHSELCLRDETLATRGPDWLHLPRLQHCESLGSVTRGNQLQAQYLTLIFITQPTNKFRLHKPQYKADFMTIASIPSSGPASKSQWCPELQM